jgi:iron complex outermembrane receptor protein
VLSIGADRISCWAYRHRDRADYGASQRDLGGTLGEVIVTARKFEENLQDTPIAVTVFTGSELEARQIFKTDRLDEVVPNLQFANNAPLAGNNSSSQVFIRGIGQTDPTSTVDPGVGLYIDDVYMGSSVGANMELRDISSVQVLRGPQGTLFGRNTIGGAIVMTTKDPGDDFGGTVRLGGGSDSLIDAFGALDVPFSDTFKSRFTAGLRKQDGYVTRTDGEDLGDTNTYTVTAKLLWRPSDTFEGRFLADYTKSDENGSPLVFAAYTETAAFGRVASLDAGCPGLSDGLVPPPGLPDQPAVPMIADDRCANDLQNRGPYHNNGTAPLTSQLENWGGSLNLTFNFNEALALKSISSYRGTSWAGNRHADNTPLPILHTFYDVDGWQWSQELQLRTRGPLKGVFGAYYFEQASDDIVTITLNPPVPPPGPNLDKRYTRSKTRAGPCSRNGPTGSSMTGSASPSAVGTRKTRRVSIRISSTTRLNEAGAGAVVSRHLQQVHPSGSSTSFDQTMIYVSYQGFKGGG